MLEYRVIHGKSGIKELEKEITRLLNLGWKPIGGISFNQGHFYQAMAGKVKTPTPSKSSSQPEPESSGKNLGAVEGMQKFDQLT